MSVQGTAKSIIYAAWAVAAIGLSGCGGSTATTNQLTTVSGVVADGYLEKAKVFLDLNDDKVFTTGEPTATTAADGSYTLTGVSAADLKKHAIVVLAEQNVTINHEGSASTPVTDAYVLSTPPDAPKTAEGKVVITPLTTLINNQIESNPTLSVASAEASVKSSLGVAPASSLFEDFVQKKGASADYDKLSKVSQVIANAIGSNMTAIQQAAPQADLNDVMKVIVAEVMIQLPSISNTVASNGTFDAVSIASSVSVDTSNSTVLQDTLTQAGTATVVSSFQTALGTDGFFSIDRESFSASQFKYTYEVVKLGASGPNGYSLTEENFVSTYFTPAWTASPQTKTDYSLTSAGWAPFDDSASAGTLVFNADGTATWTLTASGLSQVISVSKVDVAGKPIKMFLKDVPVTADAAFPVGSEAYKMTFIPKSDIYKVWMTSSNLDMTALGSVAEVISHFAANGQNSLHIGSGMNGFNFMVKFAGSGTSGTAQFYHQQNYGMNPEMLATTGTWKIVEPVANYPVLVLDVPAAYKSLYMSESPSRGVIFALVNGSIRQGSVEYANVPKDDSGMNFNKTAFTAIKDNFAPVWMTSPNMPKTAKLAKATKKFRMM